MYKTVIKNKEKFQNDTEKKQTKMPTWVYLGGETITT